MLFQALVSQKKKNFPQLFFPAFGQSVASQPKFLAPGGCGLFVTLQCLRVMLGSFLPSELQVRQIRHLALVSQAAPRELRTNKHNILSIRSALLPMDQGVRLLHWVGGLPSSRTPQHWGGVWARGSKNATKLSYHCLVAFCFDSASTWLLQTFEYFPEI